MTKKIVKKKTVVHNFSGAYHSLIHAEAMSTVAI